MASEENKSEDVINISWPQKNPPKPEELKQEEVLFMLETEEMWNDHYDKACELCSPENRGSMTLRERVEMWEQLGVCAASDDSSAPQEIRGPNAAKCFYNAFKFMNMSAHDDSEELAYLMRTFFDLILSGKISHESAKPAIDLARNTFKYSLVHASAFWECYRAFKSRLLWRKHRASGGSEMKAALQGGMLEIFEEQFKYVHLKWVKDYESFSKWAKTEKLPESLRIPIQQLYYDGIEEADFLTENYMEFISNKNERHHNDFEEYVMNRVVPQNNLDRLIVICREVLNIHNTTPCFQMVFLKALCQENYIAAMDEERTILHETIVCGVSRTFAEKDLIPNDPLGPVCDNAYNYYIQFAFQAAVKFLSTKQILQIIDAIVRRCTLTRHSRCNFERFYVSRRNIIFALKAMVQAKKLPFDEMKLKFDSMMLPVTSSYFTLNELPEECTELEDITFKLLELYKLWILCEKEARNLTWDETIEMWCTTFKLNHSPIMLLAYTEFVRQYGTYKQASKSYKEAIVKLDTENQDGHTTSYQTRKCHLQVLKNYIDLKMLHGKADLELIAQLAKLNTDFYLRYDEKYDMQQTQFDKIVGETYGPSYYRFKTDPGKKTSEHPDEKRKEELKRKGLPIPESPRTWAEFEQMELTYPPRGSNEDFNSTGYPVFLSNLNYRATDVDVVEAFKAHNITVIRTKIRRNLKGVNCGYGRIDLATRADQDRALANLDHIKIRGRETFVSEHVLGARNITPLPPTLTKPTVLIITGLSSKWTPVTINDVLAPYGHIKSVDVNNKLDPPTVRVEYVMTGDAAVGYDKIKEGEIFEGETVKVRKGYAGSKRAHLKTNSPVVDPKVVPKHVSPKSKTETEESTDAEEDRPGPYVPLLQPRLSRRDTPRTLIPRQVLRGSKQEQPPQPEAAATGEDQPAPGPTKDYSRYRNPDTYSTTSPTSSSNSEDLPPPKKLKNSDFRDMLLRNINTEKPNK